VRASSPFEPEKGIPRAATWVEPELVAQIGFMEWTPDGRLRHPSFLGLRFDKAARDVVREEP
jgi:bifunctional non-homologous end joining protein LigD